MLFQVCYPQYGPEVQEESSVSGLGNLNGNKTKMISKVEYCKDTGQIGKLLGS